MTMKVHQLLDSPAKWHQSKWTTDASGNIVAVDSPDAAHWDLCSAIHRCYPGELADPVFRALEERFGLDSRHNYYDSLREWDHRPGRTFDEVRDVCVWLDI